MGLCTMGPIVLGLASTPFTPIWSRNWASLANRRDRRAINKIHGQVPQHITPNCLSNCSARSRNKKWTGQNSTVVSDSKPRNPIIAPIRICSILDWPSGGCEPAIRKKIYFPPCRRTIYIPNRFTIVDCFTQFIIVKYGWQWQWVSGRSFR